MFVGIARITGNAGIEGERGAQSEPTEVKYVMIDEVALIAHVWPPLSIKGWIMHAFPHCVGTTDDLDYSDGLGNVNSELIAFPLCLSCIMNDEAC